MKTLRLALLLGCACFNSLVAIASSPIRISLKGKEHKLLKIIILQDASVHVKGYKGNDLIITGKDDAPLKQSNNYINISSLAVQLNNPGYSGFNPQIRENNEMIVLVLQPTDENDISIQVPEQMHFSLQFVSHLPHSELSLTNLSGELMISANVPSIFINNISGPLSLNSAGINLKKVINIKNIDWDKINSGAGHVFAISALNADVNLYLPAKLKASLNLNAIHNRVYSDLPPGQLKFDNLKNGAVAADLNGGGTKIFITSGYGNILLQKEP
ncbi:MAG TPA: hypothetical protein VIJ27_11170 [Mucilaginibacter sp.]